MPSLAQMLAEKQAKEKAAKEAAEATAKQKAATQAQKPAPISMSPSPDKAIEPKREAKPKEMCDFCGKEFTNLSAHVKKCKDNPDNAEQAPPQAPFDFKNEVMPLLTKIAGEIKADVIQAVKNEIESLKKVDNGKKADIDVETIKASIIEAIKANNPVFDFDPIKGDIIKAIEANKQQPGSPTALIDVKSGQNAITTEGLRFFVENFVKPRCRESGQAAKNLLTRAHAGKLLTVMLDVDSLVDK